MASGFASFFEAFNGFNGNKFNSSNTPSSFPNEFPNEFPNGIPTINSSFSIPFPVMDNKGQQKIETINMDLFFDKKKNKDDEYIFNVSLSMFGSTMGVDAELSKNKGTFNFNFMSKEYDDDLDIIRMHQYITYYLTEMKEKELIELNKELSEQQQIVLKPQKAIDRNRTLRNIESLQEQIQKIKDKIDYKLYIENSAPILEEYSKLGSSSKYITLGSQDITDERDKQRQLIIQNYLTLASRFIDINLCKHIQQEKNICPVCMLDIDPYIKDAMKDDKNIICPKCNCEIPLFTTYMPEDTNENNNNAVVHTNDLKNFYIKISEYEGNPPKNCRPDIEQILDQYLIENNLDPCKVIQTYPLNGRKRGNTSKKMLLDILKKLKHVLKGMYKHAEWICVTYWGWTRHNLSDYMTQLTIDFNASQEIINKHKEGRTSNLSRDYRLYRHLEKLGYPYLDIDDFKITRDSSLDYHENMWFKHILPELGWDKLYEPKLIKQILLNK